MERRKIISIGAILCVGCSLWLLYRWYDARDLLLGKETIKKGQTIIQSSVLPSSLPLPLPLPPVHINSSWLGNQWIPPPGYKTYSADEIQNYFHQQSILIVGDSTARRMYSTLYGILNATENSYDIKVSDIDSPSILNINRGRSSTFCHKVGYQVCRKMPTSSINQTSTNRFNYDLLNVECLFQLADIAKHKSSRLWTQWVQNYSLVIFVIGPHEVMNYPKCVAEEHAGRKIQTDDFFNQFFQNDDYLNGSNTTFVWRTWGMNAKRRVSQSSTQDNEKFWGEARTHNAYVKTLIDTNGISRMEAGKAPSSISYIDFGQAVLPRLYPAKKRIHGLDHVAHYGLEIRLAFVQMLMNHLVEKDRQKKIAINPWLSKELVTTRHGYNDTENFMIKSSIGGKIETSLV
jgi:hypothetical protein